VALEIRILGRVDAIVDGRSLPLRRRKFVLGERLGPTQRLGFVIAIAGVALIAAGP
jgi:hypothetical protein